MATITKESLNRQIATSPLAQKYAKRIGLLEAARKVAGEAPMTAFQKYYAGQLFENIQKGNLYEAYTQPSMVGNYKRDAFNITSIAIQNTILPEIVSVQPMSTAAQLLPLLEIRYGATKGAVTEGDLVIDSAGQGKTDKYYDSKIIKDQKVAVATTDTDVVIPFTPVDAGSVRIVCAEGHVITDDGQGTLKEDGSTDAGTIDYANGVMKVKASAQSDEALLSYTYNNANIPTPVGDLTMGINPVLITAEEHKIKAVYAITAAYRVNKEYGVNMPLEFEKQVANEMNKEKERIVMQDIFASAAGGNSIVWSATPRPGTSDAEHVESLPIAINLAASEIYTKTGGNLTPNFVVAGSNVVAYLQKCRNFEAQEAPKNGGSFFAGNLGTLAVYQTPGIGANDFFLGCMGNDFWQAGYIVGDYMPATFTSPVSLADFSTQQRMGFYLWKQNGCSKLVYKRKNYCMM